MANKRQRKSKRLLKKRRLKKVRIQTDRLVNLVANFAHYMYDEREANPDKAQYFLGELWDEVMKKSTISRSLTRIHVDRCSEGGFVVHYPADKPVVLNCFIKKTPSRRWADQAHIFSEKYSEGEQHDNYRMAATKKPFEYKDGRIIFVTDFIPGLDLDSFFLGLSQREDNYNHYIEAIAHKALDDLVFWQKDTRRKDVMMLPKPKGDVVIDGLRKNILLAAEHAREYGSVDIVDEELELLDRASNLLYELVMTELTIVPVADYCPKNMGILKEKVDVTVDDIIAEISTKCRPDSEKIANKLHHWDPAAKWGHFLEDFFAFFDSYEFGRFTGRPIMSLDDRYKAFLSAKYNNDREFGLWVDEMLGTGFFQKLGLQEDNRSRVAKTLMQDKHLIHLYRSTRKADLCLTKYSWMNEKIGKGRAGGLYGSTKDLLHEQLPYYSGRAVEAISGLITLYGDEALEKLSEVRKLECGTKKLDYLNRAFEESEKAGPDSKRITNALFLCYIAEKLRDRKTDYQAIRSVEKISAFSKPPSTGG